MYIKIYPLAKTEHSNTWTSLCANGYHDNVDFINVKHRFHRNILGTPFVTILDLTGD